MAVVIVCLAVLAAGCSSDRGTGRAVVECRGGASIDFSCLKQRYDALAATRGSGPAIADLLARRERSGYVRAACHQLMHVIGRATGRRLGIRALDDGDPTCSSGYHHGVVEAVTGRIGAHDVLRDGASVCAGYRRERPGSLQHYNCAHGMGHGYMGVYRSDVFKSLDGCATLPGPWEREHCEGGVFMENLTAMDNPERPSRFLRPRDPLYPCTVVAERHKASCYVKQAAYPLFLTNGDFSAAFELCGATPDVRFRPDCRHGIGAAAVIRANKYVHDPADARATVRALCGIGRGLRARRDCITGAVTAVVKDAATRATNLAALCRSFGSAALRATCSRTAALQREQFPSVPASSTPGWEPLCHLAARGSAAPAARQRWRSLPANPERRRAWQ